MTDLELTKLCAKAMELTPDQPSSLKDRPHWYCRDKNGAHIIYDPLHDDTQAMALVKRFGLVCEPSGLHDTGERWWRIWCVDSLHKTDVTTIDLNRAIVECVAKMQHANSSSPTGTPPTEAQAK